MYVYVCMYMSALCLHLLVTVKTMYTYMYTCMSLCYVQRGCTCVCVCVCVALLGHLCDMSAQGVKRPLALLRLY